jgi:hypothetical protein
MAIGFSFLFLRREQAQVAQGVETLEGNKGGQASQTRWETERRVDQFEQIPNAIVIPNWASAR